MTQDPARMTLPAAGELRADVGELLTLIAPPGGEAPRTMTLLALQPDLLSPFLGWAAALALNGVLSHRDHELLALRIAWRCRSAFEWGEHVGYALAAGLTDAEIAAIPGDIDDGESDDGGGDGGGWSEHERALLHAADELHERADVSPETWTRLAAHFDPPALVEIPFVVGQYTMLSMVANLAGIEPPAGASALP